MLCTRNSVNLISPVNILLDTFVNEADGTVIPAMRNLLFREEMVVRPVTAV